MSIHSLPTELLQYIIFLVIPTPFSRLSHGEYLVRNSTLCSLALVHPSWSRLAQELLFKEIWLNEGEEGMARKGRQIVKSRGKFKTKALMVEGCLDTLLVSTKYETWEDVIYLEHVNWEEPQPMSLYTEFPKLETLSLRAIHELRDDYDGKPNPLPFGNLRRLEIHLPFDVYYDEESYRSLLLKASVPRLLHLVLDFEDHHRWESLCQEVLPQLRILDLQNTANIRPPVSVLGGPTLLENLKHLSFHKSSESFDLAEVEETEEEFEDSFWWLFPQEEGIPGGFDLDCLHIYLTSDPAFTDRAIPQLARIANGLVDEFRAKRVVVYGSTKELVERDYPGVNFDGIEWGENWDSRFDDLGE